MEGCHLKEYIFNSSQILGLKIDFNPTSIIKDSPKVVLWFSIACFGVGFTLYILCIDHVDGDGGAVA